MSASADGATGRAAGADHGTLGVLVAGGAGARLDSGRPKALLELGGRTLLARACETLAAVCDVVVVAAPESLAVPLPAGVVRVHDPPGVIGPLGGMVAGLSARPYRRAIVLGVDFPFMPPALLRALRARLDEAIVAHEAMACGARAIEAIVPAPGGIAQPLVAAYAPGARDVLAARLASGERAPSRAILALAATVLDDAVVETLPGGHMAFFNLNTPADLETARRRMRMMTESRG
ncbi:MAG: molybdenum cofactor guanylyltransferase [Candidatus Eisenbacteria bacterium]|uniref:Molybdenum cofactor guanylyltransferase n=1 Tax=Eiseniibacteriota bacterium TaxID=2212470 RepID=A0A9D6LC99_UNCEI|nr:molybdenum cofactor guanylyltransferase [Candidatus Eisenbacteria bacterium]MBI3540468.1 molybdenum cofactor guanylyltransferase [Candidatus Eisenbacteria bacterium]